jgi:hypothetical protein
MTHGQRMYPERHADRLGYDFGDEHSTEALGLESRRGSTASTAAT